MPIRRSAAAPHHSEISNLSLRLSLQNGKTVDLSEIVDVRLEFDDPTLVLVRTL